MNILNKHFEIFKNLSKEDIISKLTSDDFQAVVMAQNSKEDIMKSILEKQLNEFNFFIDQFNIFLYEDNFLSFLSSSNKISTFRDLDFWTISFFGDTNIYSDSYYNERELFFNIFDDFFSLHPNIKQNFSIIVESSNRKITINFKPKFHFF